jgi:hypothetical protein
MILGHVAVSTLLHHYLKADLAPVMAGGMFPDLVDKTLCQVLHLTPSGRMYAHTLLGLGLSTAVVGAVWGARQARSWCLGYGAHLVADAGGPVPWLYPFRGYDFSRLSPTLGEILRHALADPAEMGLELSLLLWALFAVSCRGVAQDERVR